MSIHFKLYSLTSLTLLTRNKPLLFNIRSEASERLALGFKEDLGILRDVLYEGSTRERV